MVKHAGTYCWQQSASCLSVFDHFVRLALKGLTLASDSAVFYGNVAFSILVFYLKNGNSIFLRKAFYFEKMFQF